MSTVTPSNRTHNMVLVKLDKRIREAINEAIGQSENQLIMAEVVGTLECVKLELLLREVD